MAVFVAAWHTGAGPCRALYAVLEALFAIEAVCTSVCTCGGKAAVSEMVNCAMHGPAWP